MHDLYIALCTHHPKSYHLPSPYIWPSLPFTMPPFPLVTTILLSEFQFYISHMSEIIWFLAFFWLILLSMTFSRSMHVVTNGVFHLFFLFTLLFIPLFFPITVIPPLTPSPCSLHTVVHDHGSFFLFTGSHPHQITPRRAVSLFFISKSVSVLLLSSVCSLNSTCEWNDMVFVFLWLFYFQLA